MKYKNINQYYVFQTAVSLLIALAAGAMWTLYFLKAPTLHGFNAPLFWAIFFTLLLPLAIRRQQRLYHRHTRKVLFMLDAIENNDTAIHFSETDGNEDSRLINRSLNRVARILYNVKSETAQQEKYYELILDCVNTGIVVLNDNGAIYQKNNEALHLLGLEVFTHIRQLSRVDNHLMDLLTTCRSGDKFQVAFGNERGTVNLSVRVSDITVRKEHLRILALNDINSELDEKEIDSWIRLTRVLTHEIMNTITPITSLSDTLLELTEEKISKEEIRNGLETISSTSKDENLISQVIINLLKNAMQAFEKSSSPAEEKHIHIRAYCDEAEAVLIEISNNGPAIPPNIAEHIFIPFFTTKENGSGIGLSISRQIMRLSGGNLSLRPGKETTFVLKFN